MLRKPQESSSASLLRQNMTAANQICRSALGNSPDIKNRHKWITTAPRNPCQPYTQPQVLGWVDYGIWHCQGDASENSKHFLSEDFNLVNGYKILLPASCFWQNLNIFVSTLQRSK